MGDIFTLKEIEKHRQLTGKVKGISIGITLLRGRKFKEEGNLISKDIIYPSDQKLIHGQVKMPSKHEGSIKGY